jgi:hypothetical protein
MGERRSGLQRKRIRAARHSSTGRPVSGRSALPAARAVGSGKDEMIPMVTHGSLATAFGGAAPVPRNPGSAMIGHRGRSLLSLPPVRCRVSVSRFAFPLLHILLPRAVPGKSFLLSPNGLALWCRSRKSASRGPPFALRPEYAGDVGGRQVRRGKRRQPLPHSFVGEGLSSAWIRSARSSSRPSRGWPQGATRGSPHGRQHTVPD